MLDEEGEAGEVYLVSNNLKHLAAAGGDFYEDDVEEVLIRPTSSAAARCGEGVTQFPASPLKSQRGRRRRGRPR